MSPIHITLVIYFTTRCAHNMGSPQYPGQRSPAKDHMAELIISSTGRLYTVAPGALVSASSSPRLRARNADTLARFMQRSEQ